MRHELEDDDGSRVEAALKQAFAPDDAALAAVVARVEAAARRRTFGWLRVAALVALALAITGGVFWLRGRGRDGEARREVAQRWAATYHEAVANGYPAPGCCRPGVDLVGHCNELYSCSLQLGQEPALELIGFYCGAFCGEPGTDPTVLLMRAHEQPVCVFVERLARDPKPDPSGLGDLYLHRRSLPPLVLYERSRARTPTTLQGFSVTP